VTGGLADVVRRDPFVRPLEFRLPEGDELAALLRDLVPEAKRKKAVMITNPAARPMNVIGSKQVAGCAVCGSDVWLAPSGQLYLAEHSGDITLVCLDHVLERIQP
jgi:hypothetical protein